jgi:hypothetical protein
MAHFAQIDDNGIVTQVIVVNNNELLDADGVELESKGADFCISLFGGKWVQTSYSGKFRSVFAGLGYKYDPVADRFFELSPAPSPTPTPTPPPSPNGTIPGNVTITGNVTI